MNGQNLYRIAVVSLLTFAGITCYSQTNTKVDIELLHGLWICDSIRVNGLPDERYQTNKDKLEILPKGKVLVHDMTYDYKVVGEWTLESDSILSISAEEEGTDIFIITTVSKNSMTMILKNTDDGVLKIFYSKSSGK